MSKRRKVARMQRSSATAVRDLWFARCQRGEQVKALMALRRAVQVPR